MLANQGVRVIVAGLDMDYKGVPFKNMANLMATSEYVTKVHAICPKTGGLAQYSYRKTKSKNNTNIITQSLINKNYQILHIIISV